MKAFDETVDLEIKRLLQQKNYPCIAALQSYHRKDYWLKTYQNFGGYHQRSELREDLLNYLNEYEKSQSPYFTFWAVFDDVSNMNEDQYELNMWQELSSLTSAATQAGDHDARFSDDPADKNFCFSIGGRAFFVVGLHPRSSRLSRRFPWPALVFNTFEQFETLKAKNQYYPMIETNRARDEKFQGSVNPMVALYADLWESIQFSGKKNENTWQCPFRLREV